jgi:hypothetical protein
MRYYTLEPEVAGGIGPRTVMDRSTHPPIVTTLHYVMDGWLGDELLEGFPVFIVTQRLGVAIKHAGLTGVRTEEVQLTVSDEFQELYPKRPIPPFFWLKITGKPGVHDFGMSKNHRLVISDRALQLMRLRHCGITDFSA